MDNATRRIPAGLTARARSFLSGQQEIAPARGAATVVLLRDATEDSGSVGESAEGVEVYLLRRHLQMAFAAGMYAFPGGTVDPRDFDAAVAWAGPSSVDWARRLTCAEDEARALICAAVRETFEESGVLLAGATHDTVVADTTGEGWEQDRAALVDRSLSFTDFLDRRGLVLRSDLLVAWAHWITPEFEPRRYDTRFFLAQLPNGQLTRDVSGEADRVVWMRPAATLSGVADATMQMLPPTYVTLEEMTAYPTPAAAMAAGDSRVITTIMPRVSMVDGELLFTDMAGPPAAGAEGLTMSDQAWTGGAVGVRGVCVLAPNPGPMTLDGTNTWVLREPGATRSVVVDPGPLDPAHLDRVAALAGPVAAVLLTHGHLDHSEGARAFAERMHCGVRALDPAHVYGAEGLRDGDVVEADGLEISVVGTPGHTSDSLSFLLTAERALLTGDTVLGRGTTVVAHPDGELGAYLGSLRRLRDLADVRGAQAIWPGHGPVLTDAPAIIDAYLAHRAQRLEQVRVAVADGAVDASDVVRVVYADVDRGLWPAAELSVRAQLAFLHDA